MVRILGDCMYLHLARTRSVAAQRVVLRVRLWSWFELGATDVVEAPHADLIRSYASFPEAAAAVHRRMYGTRVVYWNEYEVCVRWGATAGLDPRHRGSLRCRFYVDGDCIDTHASPLFADVAVTPAAPEKTTPPPAERIDLRLLAGTSSLVWEWVPIGLLRPFVPLNTPRAAIEAELQLQISQERHHMNRGGAKGEAHRRRLPAPDPHRFGSVTREPWAAPSRDDRGLPHSSRDPRHNDGCVVERVNIGSMAAAAKRSALAQARGSSAGSQGGGKRRLNEALPPPPAPSPPPSSLPAKSCVSPALARRAAH